MAVRGTSAGYASPRWSPGVEEQFYLVWPAIVLFTPTKRRVSTLIGVATLGVLSRVVLAVALFDDGSSVTVITPSTLNLDPLTLGALLAWHHHALPFALDVRRRWTRRARAAGLLLLSAVVALSVLGRGLRVLLVIETLAAALIAVWLVDRASVGFSAGSMSARLLGAPTARYLGTISYGIYVTHGPVRWAIAQTPLRGILGEHDTLLTATGYFFVVLACTIAASSLSWYGLERPLNRLKRHFPYTGTA